MPIKSIPMSKVQFKLHDDEKTFEGYASSFGNVDAYGDTIVKGAYLETLKANGLPKMFFNHDSYQVPIGKWVAAKEDDYGLLLTGEFTPGNSMAIEVKAALKHGTVDSLSIGYALKKGDFDETESGRTIKKVAMLRETSIVTFPADKFATVNLASVKSVDFEALLPECKTERDIEQLLRDAGLGKWEAKLLVSQAKAVFEGRDALNTTEAKKMADLVQRVTALTTIGA